MKIVSTRTPEQKRRQAENTKRWRERHPEQARAIMAAYRDAHKDALKAYARTYKEKNSEAMKARRRLRDQENRDLILFNNRLAGGCLNPPKASGRDESCAICGDAGGKICADHDHSTGLFRGWLCCRCNRAIGLLGDSIAGLRAAVRYLEVPI